MQLTIRGTLPLGFLGLVFATFLSSFVIPIVYGAEYNVADSIIAPFRDSVYEHSLTEPEIQALHSSSLSRIHMGTFTETETVRAETLIHYYLGRYYQAIKTTAAMAAYAEDLRARRYLALRKYYTERESALEAYELARSSAERYLDLEPGADSNSIYGEVLGQMLFLGNAAQALSIGPKARKHVKTALKLDPEHVKALIQEASRLAYSPEGYGGNPEAARTMYRKILRGSGTDKEDLFNIYSGFAMAAFMENRDTEAVSWFQEASIIYPGNIFTSGMVEYLEQVPR